MENLPEMEMWGSFSFGSDQEKLNLLLMAEMALDTAFFALFMALEMLLLILEKILETVVFAALKPLLMPLFTEEEKEVCLRGRNAHVSHVPKNSSVADYHAATAFECVFGYLYLKGELERLRLFFDKILEFAETEETAHA